MTCRTGPVRLQLTNNLNSKPELNVSIIDALACIPAITPCSRGY